MSEIFASLKKSDTFGDKVTGLNFKTVIVGIISVITLEDFNIVKYSFSNFPNLRNFRIGNSITFSGCDDVVNDGEFVIEGIDYDAYWIKIRNVVGVADIDGGGTVDLSIQNHALATYDVKLASGEAIINKALPSSAPTSIKKIVGTSPVRLITGTSILAQRKKLSFQPIEESGVPKFYMGDSNVTSSGDTQGIEIYSGVLYEMNDKSEWYIVSNIAAQAVVIVERA